MTDAATLDPDLLVRFVAEADAAMRPADDLVRDFADGRRSARDAEIDQALRDADDPRTAFVSHEEVEAEWLRQRAHLLHRIDDGAARESVGYPSRRKATNGSIISALEIGKRRSTLATGSELPSGGSATTR